MRGWVGAKGEQQRDHVDSHSLLLKTTTKLYLGFLDLNTAKEDKIPAIAAPLGVPTKTPRSFALGRAC